MSSWKERNVFITGVSGLLGSWVIDELVRREATVTCLLRDEVCNSRFFTSQTLKKVNIVRGNVEDLQLMQRAINEYEVDTCFHLAAQAIVGTAIRSPVSTFESNIKGTWATLEACRQVDTVKRIVVSSSDKAYGAQDELPYKEEFDLKASEPYGTSKACCDLISQCYASTYGLPIAITRFANLYGGGDLNFNRIIPGTIKSLIEKKPVVIRSDGNFLRDFIYIKDAVDGYLLLGDKVTDKSLHGEAFNFGNGKPIKVIDLAKLIIKMSRIKDAELRVLGEAKEEIRDQYVSPAKAKERLGWEPTYSLERGLEETFAWYKDFFKRKDAVKTGHRPLSE